MLIQNLGKLLVRLIILTTLLGALFFTPIEPTHNMARAETTCDNDSCTCCDIAHEECDAGCPPLGQTGHFACLRFCSDQYKACVQQNCF